MRNRNYIRELSDHDLFTRIRHLNREVPRLQRLHGWDHPHAILAREAKAQADRELERRLQRAQRFVDLLREVAPL